MGKISDILEKLAVFLRKNMIVVALLFVTLPLILVLAYTFSGINEGKDPQKKNIGTIEVSLKSQQEIINELIPLIKENDYETFDDRLKAEVKDINATNAKGNTLMIAAVGYGNLDIVQLLLSRNADINKSNPYTGDTALMVAINKNDEYMTELLLIAGADVNATNNYGRTPLLLAAEVKNNSIVERLIARGAIAGAKTDNLFYFITKKNVVGVTAMLKSGISPNVTNNSGFTPLYMAASLGEAEMVQWLLSYRANINAAASDGSTALIGAARYKKPQVVELLLDKGANIDAQNKKGETALYWASANNMVKSVNQLLLLKANPALKTKEGVTPYQIAQKRNYKDLLSVFKKNKISK
ncbi:ankyrin repeat protein [Elusimicrobium simillimum]|uniref:ankyrin repeat domain-containing protein n=1 Tax=Elusimicrobium simillimum TaxID=3143438 RepID=UPI003C6ED11E